MSTQVQAEVVSPQTAAYRGVSWVCLIVALTHVLATLLAVYVIREGNLGDFSPLKIMHFIPLHALIWRCAWLAAAASSLSYLVLVVCICALLDRKLRRALTVAILFTTVALANDLSGQFSMMVLFSDLAQQLHGHGTFLQHETVQLAWATMNQALSQTMLIANTLYSAAGMLVVVCALLTRSFPAWLAWLGLPVWMARLNVSILVFVGALKWALVLLVASTVGFVVWTTVMGMGLRLLGKPQAGSSVS